MPEGKQGNLPSSFNLDAFQQGAFEGKGDTRRIRLEPGEYPAQIVGPWGEKTKLKAEKGYLIFEAIYQPDDEAQRQKLGVERLPTVRQSIFLDLTPNGALDMGEHKNGDLNRLREVCGLNEEGMQWKFQDFIGKAVKIKVAHKPSDDPENPYSNVVAVTKL